MEGGPSAGAGDDIDLYGTFPLEPAPCRRYTLRYTLFGSLVLDRY